MQAHNLKPTARRDASPAPQSAKPRVAMERLDAGHPLPIWLSTDAIALLDRIVAERPERTRRIVEWSGVGPDKLAYGGKTAAALRAIWNDWFTDRAAWCDAARPDEALYHKRRDALIDYASRHSADEVIERVLERGK